MGNGIHWKEWSVPSEAEKAFIKGNGTFIGSGMGIPVKGTRSRVPKKSRAERRLRSAEGWSEAEGQSE